MDAYTLAGHYRRMVDPGTDPMPKERSIGLRFRSKYLDLKGSAGGFPDEAWPLFLDFARHDRLFTAYSEDRLAALWAEAWDDLGDRGLPEGLSPAAQLFWLGIKITTNRGIEIDDALALIDQAAMILWPAITDDQIQSALAEAEDQLGRESDAMSDVFAEMLLRSGGDRNARLAASNRARSSRSTPRQCGAHCAWSCCGATATDASSAGSA